MKYAIMVLRALVACVLVLFLVLAPARLQDALGRNPYREFLGGDRGESWSGVITLWHIVDFKTYQGSVTAYLEACTAEYEKANSGIYFEVVGLSPDAALERISRGDRPDIWSVPMRLINFAELAPLSYSPPALRTGIRVYKKEGMLRALPYLYSGYFLIGNTALSQKFDMPFPSTSDMQAIQNGDYAALGAQMQSALDSPSTTRYGALCAPALIAAQWGISGKLASDGDFKAGQVPYLIGDARACGDLSRKMSSGGFTFDALALGGFTDQVQYIGIDARADQERAKHSAAFVSLLLSESQQQKLTALGALPAIVPEEEPNYANTLLTALYTAYRTPLAPDPARYSQQYDMIMQDAQRALGGDEAALHSLKQRLSETD